LAEAEKKDWKKPEIGVKWGGTSSTRESAPQERAEAWDASLRIHGFVVEPFTARHAARLAKRIADDRL
jgi:hypothetical protein